MGIPQESCLDIASIQNISSSNPFWIEFLEAQSKRASPIKRRNKSKRSRRNIMKKRAILERSRRSSTSSRNGRNDEIVNKVKVLKKLVPNCESTIRMETLFRETADYIMALQMRVKVMQTVVNLLQASDEDNQEY